MTMTRRQFSAVLAAMRAAASPGLFRLALCNKTFEGKPFPEMCRLTRETGFTGMEIAPYTLSDDPASLAASRLGEMRAAMAAEGVTYVGLHSVLTAPKGMSVTTPDDAVRRRSWDYFRRLIDVCVALGDHGTMVFLGNPQRRTVGGGERSGGRRPHQGRVGPDGARRRSRRGHHHGRTAGAAPL